MRTVGVTKLHLSSWGSLKGAAWSCTGSRWAVFYSAPLGQYVYIYIHNILSYFINGAILSVDSVESALKALANGNDWPVLAKNPQNWTLEFCGISGKDGVSTRTPTESSFEVDSSVSPLPGSRCFASETGRDVSGAKVLQLLLMKTHRGEARLQSQNLRNQWQSGVSKSIP